MKALYYLFLYYYLKSEIAKVQREPDFVRHEIGQNVHVASMKRILGYLVT